MKSTHKNIIQNVFFIVCVALYVFTVGYILNNKNCWEHSKILNEEFLKDGCIVAIFVPPVTPFYWSYELQRDEEE